MTTYFSRRSRDPALKILGNGEHIVTGKFNWGHKLLSFEGLTALLQLRLRWIRPCLGTVVSVVQGRERYPLLPSGSPGSLHESSFHIWTACPLVRCPLEGGRPSEGTPRPGHGAEGEQAGKATHGPNAGRRDSVLAPGSWGSARSRARSSWGGQNW